MKWWKSYTNSMRDIKFKKLKKQAQQPFAYYWLLWSMMLDTCAENVGTIRFEEEEDLELIFDLVVDDLSAEDMNAMIDDMEDVGLIECHDKEIIVVNWERYQTPPDYSTPRVQKHREKKSNSARITETIQLFNKLTGKGYSDKTEAVRILISGRLEEGRTLDEFRAVIIGRINKWGADPVMKQYITPMTIFRPSKFDLYLNELPKNITSGVRDGTLLRVRDPYGTLSHVTQDQFDNAQSDYYTIVD